MEEKLLDVKYIAGFFDGEGCVSLYTDSEGTNHQVTVAQNDVRPLDAILEAFPGGHIYRYRRCYYLAYCGRKALPFVRAIKPYTIVKFDGLAEYLREYGE